MNLPLQRTYHFNLIIIIIIIIIIVIIRDTLTCTNLISINKKNSFKLFTCIN